LVDEVEGVRSAESAKKGKKSAKLADDHVNVGENRQRGIGLDEAVRDARKACYLRYLNGAAAVVYGIPVYLD
jgi:separase